MIDIEKLKQKIVELAPRYGINVAILFGSQARGETHPQSDIDIAISTADGEMDFNELINLTTELGLTMHTDKIEVVDIAMMSPLFRKQVAVDGVVLYQKNENVFANFVMRAYRLYFESKPLLALQTKWLKESLNMSS